MTKESSSLSTPPESGGHYASVRGLRMYYEVQGAGPALVLLHGGLCALPVWPQPVRHFSKNYRVIAPEQRGHGRTADVPAEPMDYHAMAEDTAELMTQLGVKDACVLGWSDGGVVGLDLAIHHPGLVKKLAISGANIRPSMPAEPGSGDRTAEDIPAFIRKPYEQLSPDGAAYWPVVYERLDRMWRTQPNFTREQLGRITANTLVIAGDRDATAAEETVDLWRAIPRAQLWIAPDSDHGLPLNKSAVFNAAVERFFAATD
jgi:pimeloyl-ACP methyl ester carboxylesterase